MELFSEIYGAYFDTVREILSREAVTDAEVQRIIAKRAFRDSMLFLPQKLRPESAESWGFLERRADGTLSRITKYPPPAFMTILQKRWLKSILSDPKIRLFLEEATLYRLEHQLADIEPLCPERTFRFFDIFTDGDPYLNPHYREVFRQLLEAVSAKEVLQIEFVTGKRRRMSGTFLPIRMEYSRKNDKFRLLCHRIGKKGIAESGIINVGRIMQIHRTGRYLPDTGGMAEFFAKRRCDVPVQIRVSSERNGIERVLMEFASFEKRTMRDEKSDTCMIWIWYDPQDETELLIRLLGFGPVVEILGPPAFRRQAAHRVQAQYRLMQEFEKDFEKCQKNT